LTAMGCHLIADLYDCGPAAADVDGTLRAMREAVEAMGATLLELKSHAFLPQGHTAVALLSESHLAVHSWPELGYVAVDAFTCGETVRPEAGIELLRGFFGPQRVALRRVARGEVRSAAGSAVAQRG